MDASRLQCSIHTDAGGGVIAPPLGEGDSRGAEVPKEGPVTGKFWSVTCTNVQFLMAKPTYNH